MTSIKVPGMQFRQGGRQVYALTPTIAQMLEIVPERANPDVIHDANRRLYVPHGKGFGDYVMSEPTWISGAIMAGITEDAIEWNPRTHTATIELENAIMDVRLFDGQHRRYGIEYVIRQVQTEIENLAARMDASDNPDSLRDDVDARRQWLEGLLDETIPLLLYVEDDILALQQMYADISHVRIPDPITVARFDKRNAYNSAALELAETHAALKGLVEMERNTLPRGSETLITLNQLASILRVLFTGIGGRPTRAAQMVNAKQVVERGRAFFSDMVNSSDALRAVMQHELTTAELRKRGELSINVTMMKIMAATWRELTVVKEADRADVVPFFQTLPHEPSTDPDSLFVAAGVLPASHEPSTPIGRSQELRKAVSLAVERFEAQAAA